MRAVTVTSEVIGVPELVMKVFSPSITHSPADSSSRALVRVPPASLPASGSVRPKAPSARPATRSGSHRSFWAVGAELVDGIRPEPHSCFQRDRQRLIHPGDLLDRQAEGGEVATPPAALLGEQDPEEPEIAHRTYDLDGEHVLPVPGLGPGCDLRLGEVANHPAERLLFLCEEHGG